MTPAIYHILIVAVSIFLGIVIGLEINVAKIWFWLSGINYERRHK